MDLCEDYDKLMKHGLHHEPPTLFHQLRCPTIDKEYIRDIFKLPDSFLGSGTLKEGTFVTISILQSVAVAFTAYLLVWLKCWRESGDYFWKKKFNADYDPYSENVNQDLINDIWPRWVDVAMILVITHCVYFVTGLGVCYGLCKNHCNPIVYIPWLVMTAFLITTTFLTGFVMLIVVCILSTFRDINITWDIIPMLCVFAYSMAWTYGFSVSFAHYRRRRIVQFWRSNKRKAFYADNSQLTSTSQWKS